MADLNLLRSLGQVEQFQKSQTVFEQNDAGDQMYIVLKGVFGVYIHSFTDFPVRVAAVKQGSFFGEMAVIDGWPRSATVMCEEDGAVLNINKQKFASMLESSPDLRASMLETLQNRASVTAASFADIGKEAPALPAQLMGAQCKNARSALLVMKQLAQLIRQMNELLSDPGSLYKPEEEDSSTADGAAGPVKLLPDGYVPYHLSDINDNSAMLQEATLICPHCGLAVSAYVPLFSNLVQLRVHLDGRVVYENFDILWYTNIVCPHCNYADTYQEFSARKAPQQSMHLLERFENAENFTGFLKTHKHTLDEVILSFYQSIACLQKTTGNPLRFGKAWLRLYWLYSDHGPESLQRIAAENARTYYTRFLENKTSILVNDDKMRVNAILGELSAALGDTARALEHFKNITVLGRLTNSDILQESLQRYSELRRLQ